MIMKIWDKILDFIYKKTGSKRKIIESSVIIIIIAVIIMIAAGSLFGKADDDSLDNTGNSGISKGNSNISTGSSGISKMNSKTNESLSESLGQQNNEWLEETMSSDSVRLDIFEERMEKRLVNILTSISGAGKVKVMVVFTSSGIKIPAENTRKSDESTSEKDSEGGTREIKKISSESTIVTRASGDGEEVLVILSEKSPEIKGVVVTAEGAGSAIIRENIVKAVSALLNVPVHRVQVFEGKIN